MVTNNFSAPCASLRSFFWCDFRLWGVLISHNLSWHNHIMAKVNTANKVLRLNKRTCGTCTHPHVLLKLYIHLVRPHVEFASQVWSPHRFLGLNEALYGLSFPFEIHDGPIWFGSAHILLCLLTVPHVNITSDILITSLKLDTQELKFSYFFRIVKSWNSLPLHLRKTESLDDFKDCLKSFLHMKDISTFS